MKILNLFLLLTFFSLRANCAESNDDKNLMGLVDKEGSLVFMDTGLSGSGLPPAQIQVLSPSGAHLEYIPIPSHINVEYKPTGEKSKK